MHPSSKELLSGNSIDQSVDQDFENQSEEANYQHQSPERNLFDKRPTIGGLEIIAYKKKEEPKQKTKALSHSVTIKPNSISPNDQAENEIQELTHIINEINEMKSGSDIKPINLPSNVQILISTQDNKIIYYTKTQIPKPKSSEYFEIKPKAKRNSPKPRKDLDLKPFVDNSQNKGSKRVRLEPIEQRGRSQDKSSNEQKEETKIALIHNSNKNKVKYEHKIHIKNLNKINQLDYEEVHKVKQTVFKLFYGKDGKHLFIAYLSGLLEIREMWDLSKKGKIFKHLGRIHDIVSDDKVFLIASDVEGRVVYLKIDGDLESQGYKDLQNRGSKACTHLMLTPDCKILIGYQNQLKTLTKQDNFYCTLKIILWNLKGFKKIESITIFLQDREIINKSMIRKLATKFQQMRKHRSKDSDTSSIKSDEKNNISLEVIDSISSEGEEFKEQVQSEPNSNMKQSTLTGTINQLKNIKKNKLNVFLKEKISKNTQITHDSKYLIVRDSEFKGVQIIYLLDGTLVNEYREIHKQPIVEILVSKNNQYILTASKDNKVKVFDFIKEQVVATLSSHIKPVTSIELTPDQNYLFSYGYKTQVILWSTQTWQKLCVFKTSLIVQELIVTADQRFLILEGEDKQVQYLEIEYNQEVTRIGLDEDEIEEAIVSPSDEYITFIHKDQHISVWNLEENTQCIKLMTENSQVETMVDSQTIIYTNKGALYSYNPLEKNIKEQDDSAIIYPDKDKRIDINFFIINKDGTKIFLLAQGCSLITQQRGTKKYICSQENVNPEFNYIQGCLSINEQLLFAICDFTGTERKDQKFQCIHIFAIEGNTMRLTTQIELELKALYDVCCGPRGQYIFICGESNDLLYYNIKEQSKEQKDKFQELKGHTRPPYQVTLTKNEVYVVSKNDNEIIIWKATNGRKLTIIEGSFILVFSKEQKLFGLIHHNQYKKWNDKLIEQLSDDNVPLELPKKSFQRQVQSEGQIRISGHVNKLFDRIFANFKSEPNEVQLKFVPSIAKIYFYPYKINMLHYFAYTNNQHALHACIEFGVMYQRNFKGQTPLSYAFINNSVESINYLLKYISSKTNLYAQMQQDEISLAIKSSSQILEHFFNNAVMVQKNVPQFGTIKGSGMYFHESQSLQLTQEKAQKVFLKKEEKASRIPIQFKALKFKLNFQPGTKESLNLHRALYSTDADGIFKTEAIQMILKYKWSKVRLYSLINVVPLLAFAILLFVHSLQGRFHYQYLIFFGIFGLIFGLIEGIQMIVNFKGYFTDFWNIFDLIRLIFIIVYIFLQNDLINKLNNLDPQLQPCLDVEDTRGCFPDEYYYPQNTLVVLSSFVWIRILSYLRLFQQTRALIRLLIEVIKDMMSFTIVLFVALIAFAINFTNLNNNSFKNNHGLESFGANLKQTFLLVFSSFTEEIHYAHSYQMILFTFAVVLIPLIMLNMLIAIMSDTFERVSSTRTETDGRELNLLILEQESLMFWVKDKKPKSINSNKNKKNPNIKNDREKKYRERNHLHWVTEFSSSQQWAGRLQVIQQTIFQASQTNRDQDEMEQVMQRFNENSKKQFNALSMRFSLFQKSIKRQIRGLKMQIQGEEEKPEKKRQRRQTLKQITFKSPLIQKQSSMLEESPQSSLIKKLTKINEYPAQVQVDDPITIFEQTEEVNEAQEVSSDHSYHSDE